MFENNAICKLLNIKYPIFQGGMAWIGRSEEHTSELQSR